MTILDQFNLSGKIALVTGSSRGLGAGIALALAEAGATAAIHGSTTVPSETEQKLRAQAPRTWPSSAMSASALYAHL